MERRREEGPRARDGSGDPGPALSRDVLHEAALARGSATAATLTRVPDRKVSTWARKAARARARPEPVAADVSGCEAALEGSSCASARSASSTTPPMPSHAREASRALGARGARSRLTSPRRASTRRPCAKRFRTTPVSSSRSRGSVASVPMRARARPTARRSRRHRRDGAGGRRPPHVRARARDGPRGGRRAAAGAPPLPTSAVSGRPASAGPACAARGRRRARSSRRRRYPRASP